MAKKKDEQKISYAAAVRELKEKGPMRLYFLWGEEDYLTSCFRDELKKACISDAEDDFSYHRLGENFSIPALSEAVDSMPFLSERSFVEVNGLDLNRLPEASTTELIKILKDIPDYCTVVFTESSEFEPDKRLKLYKAFLPLCKELRFSAQDGSQLMRWIVRRFAADGKEIELPAAQRLISVSGELMNRLIPEIAKISAYAQGSKVTVADVDAVAHHIPEALVFDMTDRLSAGEYNAALGLLGELLADKNNEPIQILAIIGIQMRRLYAARLAIDEGLGKDYVMKTCGLKYDFQATKLMRPAHAFTAKSLADAVELCAETDYRLKSSGDDPASLLKECVLRIAVGDSNVQSV